MEANLTSPGETIPGWIKALSKVPKLKIIVLHDAAKWKDNDWKVNTKKVQSFRTSPIYLTLGNSSMSQIVS